LESKGGSDNDINLSSDPFNINKNFNGLINENVIVESFNSNDEDNINLKSKLFINTNHQVLNDNAELNKNENQDNVHYHSDNNISNNETEKPILKNHLSASPK